MPNCSITGMRSLVVHSISTAILLIFSVSACGNKNNKIDGGQEVHNTAKEGFVLPVIPGTITEPKERANYLVVHYWDNFNFGDTTYIHLPEITEQAFTNYIDVLPHADRKEASMSLSLLMSKAEQEPSGKMYGYFSIMTKRYLYDPNSPFRNEELYMAIAEYIVSDKTTGETEKERTKFDLEMMLKNRIGERAADFTYVLQSGRTGTLHQIKAEFVILYFYNPDCHACKETMDMLSISPIIQLLEQQNRLKILAFYPDADLDIWKLHLKDISTNWINGYDKEQRVKDKRVYDLKAIPTIYLLDRNKNVILKDVDVRVLDKWLGDKNPMLTGSVH